MLKLFQNVGTIPSMQLHALAQRRTKADSQLEHHLQTEEHARFPMLVGSGSSEFLSQCPGGTWPGPS